MTEPYILIAEDDPELHHLLARGLREEGFRAEAVSSGAELLERAGAPPSDALIARRLARSASAMSRPKQTMLVPALWSRCLPDHVRQSGAVQASATRLHPCR